ncbi:MAG: hypothetical protein Q8S13_01050 [Dehalococcoidia bacterium]|nr:hypothetical protein [Dehalococcoidia bacterium]
MCGGGKSKPWPPFGEALSDAYSLTGCRVCSAPPGRRHLASCRAARQDHALRLRFNDGGLVVCSGCICGVTLPEGVDPDMWFVEHAGGAPRSKAAAAPPLTEAARRLGLTRKDEAELLGGLVKLALRNPLAALGGALLGGAAVYSAMAPKPKVEPAPVPTADLCVACASGIHAACFHYPFVPCSCAECRKADTP